MKKKVSKIMLSMVMCLIVFTLIGTFYVNADETPDQTIEVQGEAIQTQLQSNVRTMFWFRERTKLTICANINMELDINCDALEIGNKDVIIDIEGDGDLRMTLTCTREENQLGLMNGSTHRVRNRNTYRYLEGFCIAMSNTANCKCEYKCDPDCQCVCECKCDCDPKCTCPCECECKGQSKGSCGCDCPCECDPACICECNCQCKCDPECKCNSECPYNGSFLKVRLRIRNTNQNRHGQWAYYNNDNNEWVPVSTINQEGYLVAETSVLSTWTLLVPEETTSPILGTITIVSVSVIGVLSMLVFYLKKRR